MRYSPEQIFYCPVESIHNAVYTKNQFNFWAMQRSLGKMFDVPWYEMSYVNVLRRFGDFWAVQRPLGSMFGVPWYGMSYVNVLRMVGDFLQ